MATKAAHRRLTKEYKAIIETPTPFITAHPSESNILEWHYLITGPPNTPYENGQYHGTLTFTHEYPFKPPAIRMITPNGRFQTNTRLCLSMSDYHPDTWNPSWSVSTILTGLLSFMTGTEPTTGSIQTSDEVKKKFAKQSYEWNAKSSPKFNKEFSDLLESNLKKDQEWKDSLIREQQKKLLASQNKNRTEDAGISIDLSKLDPEDRIRYLAEQRKKSSNTGTSHAYVLYYVLAIAVVLGFFRVVA